MTRQEANRQIIQILGNYPNKGALDIVDFDGTPEEYNLQYAVLSKNIETIPQYRFIQLLWAMGLNLTSRGKGDRFYEESAETLQKLINYVKSCGLYEER